MMKLFPYTVVNILTNIDGSVIYGVIIISSLWEDCNILSSSPSSSANSANILNSPPKQSFYLSLRTSPTVN